MSYKKIINKISNIFGLSVTRHIKGPIESIPFDTIFDVGANTGQYAKSIFDSGYSGKIVSFEPISAAHKELEKNASMNAKWFVHDRCAIGETYKKDIEINLSKNSVSSSILPIMNSHTSSAPQSLYVGKEKTKLLTLDSVFNDYCSDKNGNFLKIDTQGYEHNVLEGAKDSLLNINAIEIELSTIKLYEDSKLYNYYFNYFDNMGFTLWSVDQVFFPSQKDNRILQFDAIFVKKSLL